MGLVLVLITTGADGTGKGKAEMPAVTTARHARPFFPASTTGPGIQRLVRRRRLYT